MPDFDAIRRQCDGMMRPEVYQRIYETACEAPGDIFVEVGTAHAAATVCLALALKDTGRTNGKVYTFDHFKPGGRTAYKQEKTNLEIARENLEHFGVSDLVIVTDGDVRKTHVAVPPDRLLGLLMIDADGMIDRDLRTFFDPLIIGAPIIIDDCADRARVKILPGGRAKVDQKHRLTHFLARSAEKHGLFERVHTEYQTLFARKLESRVTDWSVKKTLSVYRELVFATAEVS